VGGNQERGAGRGQERKGQAAGGFCPPPPMSTPAPHHPHTHIPGNYFKFQNQPELKIINIFSKLL